MTVSSGVAMEIHYCMGKQAGVDLYANKADKCGRCGMKEKKGCCSDVHKFVKLDDSHKNVYNTLDFAVVDVPTLVEQPIFNWQVAENVTIDTYNNHSPPSDSGPSIRVLTGVFRI